MDITMDEWLSDIDTTRDGKFAIEWDGIYGKHWETFDTEEARSEALRLYDEKVKQLMEVKK
jgi:hypothetical protein